MPRGKRHPKPAQEANEGAGPSPRGGPEGDMKTVWKYDLPHGSTVTIEMPKGAKVLSVLVRDDRPVVYAKIDPDKPKVRRAFTVFATGDRLEEHGLSDYVASFQVKAMVYHVWVDRLEYPLEKNDDDRRGRPRRERGCPPVLP